MTAYHDRLEAGHYLAEYEPGAPTEGQEPEPPQEQELPLEQPEPPAEPEPVIEEPSAEEPAPE